MGISSKSMRLILLLFWILFPSETTKFNLCNGQSKMGCLEMERKALLEFKNRLKDPARRLSSWVDADCCTWEGVGCNNETGHVITINLRNSYGKHGRLHGDISDSLLRLDHLVHLDLSNNDFRGAELPDFIGSMKRLRSLILSSSGFGGTVPQHLGNLSNLRTLSLSTLPSNWPHNLQVDDIQWLSHLSSLEHLELDGVDMSSVGETWVRVLNNLPSLSYLSLFSCSLKNISQSLTSLKLPPLVHLDISKNYFNSQIPNWLFNITSLVRLELGDNQFYGRVPDAFGQLPNLSTLYLYRNSLTGPIPVSLMKSTSLRILHLYGNQLNGSVPSSLGLSQLVELHIDDNSLQGTLSNSNFSNLRSLKLLSLRKNSLAVNVSSDWIPPFQLEYLGLSYCNVGPQFPTWIRTQKNLKFLDLIHASISDTIPDWFGEVSSHLPHLKLARNRIYGQVPKSLKFPRRAKVDLSSNQLEGPFPFSSMDLSLLDLCNNKFSGPIPHDIGSTAPNLHLLSLSGNRFNDSIPMSIGRLHQLIILNLSRNQFTGNIPASLGNCSGLQALDIKSNHLSGPIPMSVSLLVNLKTMHLSNNSLSGEFPYLISCHNLVVLDLGENELSGNIPTWVGESLTSLVILRLRSNKFTGNIPPQLSFLASLQVLDLADNNLSGSIPPSFSNFTSMAKIRRVDRDLRLHVVVYGAGSYYDETVSVISEGRELEYTSTLSLVTAIYISGNRLSGEIPESLAVLSGLLVLNLTRNHLTGNIPWNIGNLSTLESLDLSNNRLYGVIPPGIADLYSLAALNVSNNNLSGMIPSGEQLKTLTDPSIYAGNPFLCGFPLQKICKDETPSVAPDANEGGEDENGSGNAWFYANLGFGFLAAFLCFFAVLLMRKHWMDIYFQFVDNLSGQNH